MIRHVCELEGCENARRASRRFCSTACSNISRTTPKATCIGCGKTLVKKQTKYCSNTCHNATRYGPVRQRTCICGATLPPLARRKYCSKTCSSSAIATKHPPETRARVSELWAAGATINAMATELGITRNAVVSLVHRMMLPVRQSPLGVYIKPRKPRKPRPSRAKAPQNRKPVWYTPAPAPVPKPRKPGDAREPIALRQLYQIAMELRAEGVTLPREPNVEMLSRAKRRVDPAHPGYVLREAKRNYGYVQNMGGV